MSVHIKLELHATLKRHEPESAGRYAVCPGMTLKGLIAGLGISEEEVNLVFINGERGNLDATLSGGERVALFPPLGGG